MDKLTDDDELNSLGSKASCGYAYMVWRSVKRDTESGMLGV